MWLAFRALLWRRSSKFGSLFNGGGQTKHFDRSTSAAPTATHSQSEVTFTSRVPLPTIVVSLPSEVTCPESPFHYADITLPAASNFAVEASAGSSWDQSTKCSIPRAGSTNPHDEQLESPTASRDATCSFLEPPAGRRRKPIATAYLLRYEDDYKIPTENTFQTIPAVTTHFPHSVNDDCGSWVPVTHPEGVLYFYDTQRHVFTDSYMYDSNLRAEMDLFVAHLETLADAQHNSLPTNRELVVTICFSDDDIIWGYYFVNHDSRSLFWLEDYPSIYLTYEVDGVTSAAHVKYVLEAQYWMHWSYFPDGPRQFPTGVCDELLGALLHSTIDGWTSKLSTIPWDVDGLIKMASVVKMGRDVLNETTHIFMVSGIGRLMSMFCHWRFLNHHGQRGARLDTNKSVHGMRSRRTLLITLISPLLFWAPHNLLLDVEGVWVEGIVTPTRWKGLVSNLQTGWSRFATYASILLATNVAFLAIPGVISVDMLVLSSPARVSSDLSIITSLGSIIASLLLSTNIRAIADASPGEAGSFLWARTGSVAGCEPMVIIYSLPYGLFMWATVTFSVAFLAFCFQGTDLWTRIPIGVASAIISVLIALIILDGWWGTSKWPWFGTSFREGWTNMTSLVRKSGQKVDNFWVRMRKRHWPRPACTVEVVDYGNHDQAGSVALTPV